MSVFVSFGDASQWATGPGYVRQGIDHEGSPAERVVVEVSAKGRCGPFSQGDFQGVVMAEDQFSLPWVLPSGFGAEGSHALGARNGFSLFEVFQQFWLWLRGQVLANERKGNPRGFEEAWRVKQLP
jgi:hypothetical protein